MLASFGRTNVAKNLKRIGRQRISYWCKNGFDSMSEPNYKISLQAPSKRLDTLIAEHLLSKICLTASDLDSVVCWFY